MTSKILLAGAALAATLAVTAQAATVTPVSYTFDQPTSCGSWCYFDTPTPSKLTDGVLGAAGWALNAGSEWDGWVYKPVVNIDFNFGTVRSISSVSIGSTQDSLGDVTLPSYNVYSSNDAVTWTFVRNLAVPPSSANDKYAYDATPHGFFTLSGLGINAKYVRVAALENGPWTFIDEVTFSGSGSAVPEPASWAMMLSGFALLGGAMRRRRALAA